MLQTISVNDFKKIKKRQKFPIKTLYSHGKMYETVDFFVNFQKSWYYSCLLL